MLTTASDDARAPEPDLGPLASNILDLVFPLLLTAWVVASRIPYLNDFDYLGKDGPLYIRSLALDDRYQVPGEWAIRRGTTYRNDGATPHWRGILDDHGRVMVAMSFNSDIGDSWEWADDPEYPEKYSALGIRIGVNYVVYSMTH